MRILEYSCGVCRKGVSDNSIRCVECLKWVHKICSGISGKLKSIILGPDSQKLMINLSKT